MAASKPAIVKPTPTEVEVYGLGHIEDRPDTRDWTVSALVGIGGAEAPPKSPGVAQWACKPLNQGKSSACVGHAIAVQLYCRMGAQGIPQVLPAPLEIYWNGRAEDGEQDKDDGSRPRSVYKALKRWGYCSYDVWPTEKVTPLQQPPWRVQRLSVDQGDVQFYRLDGFGDLLVSQVKQALANGYPVTFAMKADQSYMQYTSGVWSGMAGPALGGHDQCALDYEEAGVWVQNSWGPSWGVSGRALLSWGVVRSAWRDVYAVTFANAPVAV